MKLPASVRCVSWEELNRLLLLCEDEVQLQTWLDDMLHKNVSKTRVLRVYGRLCSVRRDRETKELLYKLKVAQEA